MTAGEPTTGFPAFRATAAGLASPARVPVEVVARVDDPYAAYRRARDDEGGVYLETTGERDGWGYFATDPADWLTVHPDGRGEKKGKEEGEGDSLDALAARLDGERLVRGDCDVPYPCGAFGWLSYDLAREIEDLPDTTVDDRGLPRLQFAVYDRVAAWRCPGSDAAGTDEGGDGEAGRPDGTTDPDGGSTELRVTACPVVAPGTGDGDLRGVYGQAVAHARDLADAAVAGTPAETRPPVERDGAAFVSETGRAEYERRVRRVKRYVRDGETFQANVSQRLVAPAAVHPVDVFGALRRINPAPYSALVEFPGVSLVSTSPELLLDAAGDRLRTEPIAGTRPRAETPAADADNERDLRDSEKERAEHAMLVDLQRNDLGKVCEYGSVDVADYRRVDRYSAVMHTVSTVTGTRRADASVTDAVRAVFPGGTITGAPKPRTMEIIDEVEATRRGPYTGSIGVFGFDDRATLNMTIRTLVERDGRYSLRVGAGIVHDSDPVAEFAETVSKGRALVDAVDDVRGDAADRSVAAGADGGAAAGIVHDSDDGGGGGSSE